MTKSPLWGGRFEGGIDPFMARFNNSIGFDARLWQADILGSQAYAEAIFEAGVLTEEEKQQILSGLDRVQQEWASGRFLLKPEDEDIHTAVERRLDEFIGPVAGKLHTGRSRNDQVATDLRSTCATGSTSSTSSAALQRALVAGAERHRDLSCPATPTSSAPSPFASATGSSYFWMLQRDADRLDDLRTRVDVLPLGVGRARRQPLPHRPRQHWPTPRLQPHQRQQPGRRQRPRLCGRVPVLGGAPDGPPQPPQRRSGACSPARIGLRRPGRRLHHGLEPDAAEEEPRRLRVGPRQIRPRSSATWWACSSR